MEDRGQPWTEVGETGETGGDCSSLAVGTSPGEGCVPGGVTGGLEVLVTSSRSSEQDVGDADEKREEHPRHHLQQHLLLDPLPQFDSS